jgi:hypothetical protein
MAFDGLEITPVSARKRGRSWYPPDGMRPNEG